MAGHVNFSSDPSDAARSSSGPQTRRAPRLAWRARRSGRSSTRIGRSARGVVPPDVAATFARRGGLRPVSPGDSDKAGMTRTLQAAYAARSSGSFRFRGVRKCVFASSRFALLEIGLEAALGTPMNTGGGSSRRASPGRACAGSSAETRIVRRTERTRAARTIVRRARRLPARRGVTRRVE